MSIRTQGPGLAPLHEVQDATRKDLTTAPLGLIDAFEPDEHLVTEALSLAIRREHPVYDLIYVVLAMRSGSRTLSADGGLLQLATRIDPNTG